MFSGLLGIIGSLCIMIVIYAHKKDKNHVTQRVIMGLAIATLCFSIANVMPLDLVYLNKCADIASHGVIAYGRVFWFAGKFAILFYEIYILLYSIYILKTHSKRSSLRTEIITHTAIWICTIIILLCSCLRGRTVSAMFFFLFL